MMNINLNLLPPAKKNTLNYIVNFLLIKDILLLLIFVGSILTITVILSWFMVQEEFANLAASAVAVDKEYHVQNEEIAKINKLSRELNSASKNFEPITAKVVEFVNAVPPGVKLNFINANRSNQSLSISGIAKTRESFLQYQETLKNMLWITDLQIPASQLFIKDNINFEFSAKLRKSSQAN